MQLHGQTCLRFCLLLCLSRVFVAFCQDTLQSADLDASIFSGEPTSNADEKWLTDPSFSSELVGFNPDDNMLTGATDFDLWSSPVENPNGNSLASCSTPHGLGARDDVSCPVPLKDGDIPKLPQNLDDLVNMGNSPNTEPKEATPPVNEIQQFFRKDPKCPQTHPHHLCCICDGAFAFEVCQDCVGVISPCWDPHNEVCCQIYGRTWEPGSGNNLDDWLSEGYYNPDLNRYGGVFAEFCLVM